MVFVDSLEIFSVSTLSRRCRGAYVPMKDIFNQRNEMEIEVTMKCFSHQCEGESSTLTLL